MVWLVTANVSRQDEYGAEICCFGIAENETALELIKTTVKEQGFEPKVTEIEVNVILPFSFDNPYYLGGYTE